MNQHAIDKEARDSLYSPNGIRIRSTVTTWLLLTMFGSDDDDSLEGLKGRCSGVVGL